MGAQTGTADNIALELLPQADGVCRRVLVIEPDARRRSQVASGLRALGYSPDAFAGANDVPWSSAGPWMLVLTGASLPTEELVELRRRLDSVGLNGRPIRSLGVLYSDSDSDEAGQTNAEKPQTIPSAATETTSDEFRIRLLRWAGDEGCSALRPEPCPDAPLGHAHHRLERHFDLRPGEAIRVLEDLADFGTLARKLSNRVYVCPNCRRWTINFRETCPNCSGLDVDVEGMIHHFACAYVGLDSEYRQGADLQCPKCKKRLNHIGLDYERPRQTYVCHTCEQVFEEPIVTAQCLDCRWDGTSHDVLPWPIYEYELTSRGQEAVERGELRGLKLREMIRTARYELASREFFELEMEREMFRLDRYDRPLSVLMCRFEADGALYALFRETDQASLQAFTRLIAHEVRSLDVAAQIDSATIAILLPETNDSQAERALLRLRQPIDGFELTTAGGRRVDRHWIVRSWNHGPVQVDEALLWFQRQLQSPHVEA